MVEIIENVERDMIADTASRLSNWGKWGPDDQIGTLNYITSDKVRDASRLIRHGNIISLSIDYGDSGPQVGHLRRFNPMTFMMRDGDDAFARDMAGVPRGIGAADDLVIMPTQGATHWDSLGHMFYDSKMWNGFDCRLVSSLGAEKNDITAYRDKIVGRGILLDLPHFLGVPWCEPGHAITSDELLACAKNQGVEIEEGDILLIRTGQMAMCRQRGSWGDFAGGDAPGLAFSTLDWLFESRVAGLATDTWGAEVRPNELKYVNQPWHRVALPQIGLLVGEIFDLDKLAVACQEDGAYAFFFCANPLPITGSVGGPTNPTVVK